MQIWELIPKELDHPNWQRSPDVRCRVVIRASTENRARDIARLTFDKGHEKPLACPWTDPVTVAVKALEGTEYPLDGPEEILEPSMWNHEWLRVKV